MKKIILIILSFFIVSTNLSAMESILSLKEIEKQIANIEKEKCPTNQEIQEISWVQQKLSCMVETDQCIAFLRIRHQDDKMLEQYQNDLNKKNTQRLKEILDTHGWVNISKFGRKADNDAWLLVQHSDHDPMFQASVAFILEALIEHDETNRKNFAYLYDRVMLKYQNLGLKQKYGTQFIIMDSDIKLQPYEGTIQDINLRRKAMGLPTVERYLNQAKATYLD